MAGSFQSSFELWFKLAFRDAERKDPIHLHPKTASEFLSALLPWAGEGGHLGMWSLWRTCQRKREPNPLHASSTGQFPCGYWSAWRMETWQGKMSRIDRQSGEHESFQLFQFIQRLIKRTNKRLICSHGKTNQSSLCWRRREEERAKLRLLLSILFFFSSWIINLLLSAEQNIKLANEHR